MLGAQRPDFKSVKSFSKGEELKFLNFLSDPCYNEITMWQSHCSGASGAKNDLLAVGTLRNECPYHHGPTQTKDMVRDHVINVLQLMCYLCGTVLVTIRITTQERYLPRNSDES